MEFYKSDSGNQKMQLDKIRKELDQMLQECQNSSVNSNIFTSVFISSINFIKCFW